MNMTKEYENQLLTLLDNYWDEYDDQVNQACLAPTKEEKQYYLNSAQETLNIIENLLKELPENLIYVITEDKQ